MKVFKYGVCASREMSELIAKSGMKTTVWDYFGLEHVDQMGSPLMTEKSFAAHVVVV